MLPTVNAILNTCAAILLLFGFINIKKKKPQVHIRFMISALAVSALFLISYVVYHYYAGSTPYPHFNWTRPLYFAILIPHIILAALQVPFILVMVWRAVQKQFDKHKKIARWVWPVWMFVSVSGILVYVMLYHF
jgi:uncharacterized membrane protein YozB (DUF420 family)